MTKTKIIAYPFGEESLKTISDVIDYPHSQTLANTRDLLISLKQAIEQTSDAHDLLEMLDLDEHPLCETLNKAADILGDLENALVKLNT